MTSSWSRDVIGDVFEGWFSERGSTIQGAAVGRELEVIPTLVGSPYFIVVYPKFTVVIVTIV
jgi:hypothetical protein